MQKIKVVRDNAYSQHLKGKYTCFSAIGTFYIAQPVSVHAKRGGILNDLTLIRPWMNLSIRSWMFVVFIALNIPTYTCTRVKPR